jgi:mannose-1-phosphate guanylyltransferase
MEKSPYIYVHPADFGWSDLGTWGSLHTHIEHDECGNATVGNVKLFDSSNCIVHAPQNRRVVVQGLDGYIVAEKDNTLLICKLDQEQRIKDFSAE